MGARLNKNPGSFKTKANRAGNTIFVAPDLVTGTLERGFAFLEGLGNPFQRAIFMMFLISEVHPFTDGNGRIARVMMNAELVAGGQERIIVPTGYRIDYLTALKAVSQSSHTTPFIRVLDRAQQYTHAINWDDLETARKVLEQTAADNSNLPDVDGSLWLFDDKEESVYQHYHSEIKRHIAAGGIIAGLEQEIAELKKRSDQPIPSRTTWWRRLLGKS